MKGLKRTVASASKGLTAAAMLIGQLGGAQSAIAEDWLLEEIAVEEIAVEEVVIESSTGYGLEDSYVQHAETYESEQISQSPEAPSLSSEDAYGYEPADEISPQEVDEETSDQGVRSSFEIAAMEDSGPSVCNTEVVSVSAPLAW